MSGIAPIDRLRRLGLRLDKQTFDEDVQWFLTALQRYESAARVGLTFDQALGLHVGIGETSWWQRERLTARDDLIRNIAVKHFGALNGRPAAAALSKAIRRYKQGRWQIHKAYATPPPELDGLHAAVFKLLKIDDPPPAEPTIRATLSGSQKKALDKPASDRYCRRTRGAT